MLLFDLISLVKVDLYLTYIGVKSITPFRTRLNESNYKVYDNDKGYKRHCTDMNSPLIMVPCKPNFPSSVANIANLITVVLRKAKVVKGWLPLM